MLNLALFGPPGAGKGTQSEFLVKKYNLFYISTGDLLRKEIADGSAIGNEVKSIIAQGGLVSDEIIVQIIEKSIIDNPGYNGFLFDGFPRTYIQAYILEGLMLKLNTQLNCLISIEVPKEESVTRLLNRGITSGRSDDNDTVIRNRLKEYYEKTIPVLQFYKDKGIYYEVDGRNGIDDVKIDITKIVKQELSKSLLNVVLFGYPGSGRSTIGKALAAQYNLEFISTGQLLVKEVNDNTKIGKKILEMHEKGQLSSDEVGQMIPDEIVVQLIEKKLSVINDQKGFIFKGFPRTLVQSYILDGLLRKHTSSITKVIEIEVPILELIRRLEQRSSTDSSMPYDSNISTIIKRLQEHEKRTVPVIGKYSALHGGTKINGVGTFEEVYQRVADEIEFGFKAIR
ncbi:MAG: adenylate kinase [Candidatus Kapabacteria bacterium]|nr:adenylate kinase [Ignavibacteriota bacterium]MCW5885458.1 adenylate kinase [Candidatus Kapabacteria bacterium]